MRLKTALSILFVSSLCGTAHAVEAVASDGSVFGVSPGTYLGSGRLKSGAMLVPDLDFSSIRTIRDGVIIAKTTARFMGHWVATASASLRIDAAPGGASFLLIDTSTRQLAGSGTCSPTECTFTAKVMNGKLRLTETWRVTAQGFEVMNASQDFNGLPARYSGEFFRAD